MWFWVLGFKLSDRTPSTSQKRSHPVNFPTSFFNEPLQTQRTQRKSDRTPSTSPNSDSYGALRYRTPSTSQKRFLRSASLSHPSNFPKQRFLRSASLSHPLNFPASFFLRTTSRHRVFANCQKSGMINW